MSGAKNTSFRAQAWCLGVAMFVMGGCGLAYEYTLSKMAADLLGNSVQQWALVIAVMLFFMGVGAELQSRIPDHRLARDLILSQTLLGLLGGFGAIGLLWIYGFFPAYFALAQYALISGIGLLIGFEIPLMTRLNEAFSCDVRTNLARILKWDYVGALCGALIWVFVLPRFFSTIETGFVLGGLTLGTAILCAVVFRHPLGPHRWWAAASLTVATAALIAGFTRAGDWTLHAEQSLYRDRVVFSKTSTYQHIVLTESRFGEVSCYINGRLQFHSADEHIYHELLTHPAMHLAARHERILILGGGDGLAVRELLKYPDVKEIVLVDLDPMMTDLARDDERFRALNQGSLSHARVAIVRNGAVTDADADPDADADVDVDGERELETIRVENQRAFGGPDARPVAKVRVLNLDASRFVAQARGKYDVIILDFPDPNAPDLAKLYSQHFYGLLRAKLNTDGILVQQATSPVFAKEAFLCIGRTMRSAGLSAVPYHDTVPSFGDWGWWIAGRDDRVTGQDLARRLANLESIDVETRYLTPDLVRASLAFGKEQLTARHDDVSTISNPCVYGHYLAGWRAMNQF